MNNDFELFPGKDLAGLFKDIYSNQQTQISNAPNSGSSLNGVNILRRQNFYESHPRKKG